MYKKNILFLLMMQSVFVIAQEQIERATRPTENLVSSCAGCSQDPCCNQVLADLAYMESQLQELIECACCQHDITQADIDEGNYTITEPGFYCLVEDVTFTGTGNAITVNNVVSEVTIDLRGHTITGDGTGVALFVTNTAYGTTIQNGSIENCKNGIYLLDATQLFLADLNISLCQNYGIFGESPLSSGGIFIERIVVRETGNDGIYMTQYGTVKIYDALIALAGGSGIHLDGFSEFTIDKVNVVASVDFGYLVTDLVQPSFAVSFNNCLAEASGKSGFRIATTTTDGLSLGRYINCKSIGNNGNGFELISLGGDIRSVEYFGCESKANSGTGFFTDSAGNSSAIRLVTYENCIAHFGLSSLSGNGDGFYVDGQYFVIKSCQASSNSGSGINLSPFSSNAQIIENNLSLNNLFGINDQGSFNLVYSNVGSGNAINYSPAVPLQLLPTDITGYWINVDPTSTTVGEYESKINELLNLEQSCCNVMGSSFDMIASEIESISVFDQSCCTYTNSNINALTGLQTSGFNVATSELNVANSQLQSISGFDQSCCLATMSAFDVVTSSIDVLDACAPIFITSLPYTISGPGVYVLCSDLEYFGGAGAAIYVNNSIGGDVVIDLRQHALTGPGSENAIQISGTVGSVLVQSGVLSGFDYGLNINANNVSINDIAIFNCNQAGIYAQSSDTLMIENATIKGSGAFGVQLLKTTNLSLSDIKVNGTGFAISIDGLSGATIKKICASRATSYGLFMTGSTAALSDIVFAECAFDLCQNGIAVEQATVAGELIRNIVFLDTIISGSLNTGAYLYAVNNATFKPVLFRDCQFLGSGVDGCWVENGQGHVFENCQAINCARFGFYLHNGSAHVLKNCTLTFNGSNPGGATEVGALFVYLCERCQVYDSVISSNIEDAVYLKDANRFLIQNSSLCNNGKGGVFMAQTTGVENARIIECTICSNAQTGVHCANSNSLVERCTISENLHGINVLSTSIDCQILNNWVANNVSRGIINDNASSYIWGNTSAKNAVNFGGSFQPSNIAPTSTSPYWANIRV